MEITGGCSLAMDKLPDTLEEVQRFLDTWCFSISDDGFFFARPQSKTLSLADIRAFLKRLDLICNDGFPRMIAIDFSRRSFASEDWSKCETLLVEFARAIGAMPIFESRGPAAAFVVLIRSVRNENHRPRPISTHLQRVVFERPVD